MAKDSSTSQAVDSTMIEHIKTIQETADLLYSAQEVDAAIEKMASQVNSLLADSNPIVLCVMNGGIIVAGQLITRLTIPLTIDAINASRYKNKTLGGTIDWLLKPSTPIKDRTLLVIDDILDEGITLAAIKEYCMDQGASVVYSAVLLNKNLGHPKPFVADIVGLEVSNRYIFGYGMDYKGYLRNANGIYACNEKEII
jgi:hypoxanthine phosphoribosyltransferase